MEFMRIPKGKLTGGSLVGLKGDLVISRGHQTCPRMLFFLRNKTSDRASGRGCGAGGLETSWDPGEIPSNSKNSSSNPREFLRIPRNSCAFPRTSLILWNFCGFPRKSWPAGALLTFCGARGATSQAWDSFGFTSKTNKMWRGPGEIFKFQGISFGFHCFSWFENKKEFK